ncbi:MAG: GAF domain-containing sensor histidine kinase [Anaerolineae bacterium]|nr:GAF domain-containing sensor histidine kinase [Anaerolineae bacterium]NUQ03305.1 GAF domain-containing sensor histidine kinase [Anaerolineae bacterium]
MKTRERAVPPTRRQDETPVSFWSIFYARMLLLAGLIAALFALRGDIDGVETNSVLLAGILGAVANLAVIPLGSARSWQPALPFVSILGDVVIVALFGIVARGNPTLVLVACSAVMFLNLLRSWSRWTVYQGAVIAAAGALVLIASTPTGWVDNSSALLVLGALGVSATIVAYFLDRTVGSLTRQVSQLAEEKQTHLTDTRERANALSELTFTLSATLNYKKVLDATLEAGRLALRLPDMEASSLIAAIYLYHVDDGQLHVVSARRYTRSDELRALAGKAGVVGQALKTASPVIGSASHEDPELQFLVAFQYCKSLLCIPLRAGFDTFGVIIFGSETPNAFSTDQGEILHAIGLQSTIALQNAVLYSNLLSEKERIIDADEEARKKLARDLHDGPTQGVAAIAMRMSYIQKLYQKSPKEVPEELKKVEELARKTTKEIRHMLFTLRPLVLETQGLSAAFNQLAEKLYEMHKQAVSVRIEGDVEDFLDQHQQGTIFYVVEEAVNNARKHAQAKMISISARRQDDAAIIQIADNGVGFNVEETQAGYDKRGSLGMVNMRERAELLDGTISIDSVRGRGAVITLIVPLKAPEAMQLNAFKQPRTKLARAAAQRVERATLDRHLDRQGEDDFYF